jgi:ribosomal protein L7Ae-like RNA K-turn-binding protein
MLRLLTNASKALTASRTPVATAKTSSSSSLSSSKSATAQTAVATTRPTLIVGLAAVTKALHRNELAVVIVAPPAVARPRRLVDDLLLLAAVRGTPVCGVAAATAAAIATVFGVRSCLAIALRHNAAAMKTTTTTIVEADQQKKTTMPMTDATDVATAGGTARQAFIAEVVRRLTHFATVPTLPLADAVRSHAKRGDGGSGGGVGQLVVKRQRVNKATATTLTPTPAVTESKRR